jgi:hypothetical protein
MAFHLPKPVVPLLVIAMGAMVLSAAAQPSGQSIIFSAPPADDAESATPTLAPPSSPLPSLPSTLQAPVSPFNYNSAPDNFPMPPQPSANSSEQQQMKKLLDDRKNWTLMTPEEIFGTATTDKSPQPAERDATGQEKTPTQLERYLDRQNQPLTDHTNNWQNDRDNAPWDLTPGRNRTNLSDSRRDGTTDMSQNLNRLFGGLRNNDILANQNANAGWDSLNPPAPPAPVKPDPEQLAAMERFRQLLAPSPAPTPEPSPNSSFFPAPKPVVDPNFTQPDFVPNPAGASFTPLTTGIGRPTGLTPLPGITSPVPHPAAAPSWAPQPPPWVSQTPQPFAGPQWKF